MSKLNATIRPRSSVSVLTTRVRIAKMRVDAAQRALARDLELAIMEVRVVSPGLKQKLHEALLILDDEVSSLLEYLP